ncbi:hypothetical protein SFRURICE_013998, partial [Spodoptera frugiperda]
ADATPHTSGQSRYVLLAVQTCLIFYQYLIIVFAVIIVHILMPIIYGNNLKACSEGVKYSVHNFRRQDSATAAKGMTRRCGELITFEEMMTSRRTAKDKAAASDREKLSELVRTPWRLSSHSSKRGLIAAMTASPALGCDSRCCHSAMRSRTSAPTREKCGRAILKVARRPTRTRPVRTARRVPRVPQRAIRPPQMGPIHNIRRQDSATAAKGMKRRCGELIAFEGMMTSQLLLRARLQHQTEKSYLN